MYTHLRKRVSQIPKHQLGGSLEEIFSSLSSDIAPLAGDIFGDKAEAGLGNVTSFLNNPDALQQVGGEKGEAKLQKAQDVSSMISSVMDSVSDFGSNIVKQLQTAKTNDENKTWKSTAKEFASSLANGNWTSAVGTVANKALDTVEGAVMKDKTFNASSEAIDNGVRSLSKSAMKFGPWGLLAAGILETANFVDKAAGKTVQGFEVGSVGSGFNGISTSMTDASFRGTQTKKMKQALATRQENINMALAANNMTETERFQLNARANSYDNVMQANRVALAGGLDTSALGG